MYLLQARGVPAGTAQNTRDKMEFDPESMTKRRFTVKAGETARFVIELKPKDTQQNTAAASFNAFPAREMIFRPGKALTHPV